MPPIPKRQHHSVFTFCFDSLMSTRGAAARFVYIEPYGA